MYTIVVADDEEDLRRTIIRKIDWESIGFQVVGEAENGVEALELVTKNEPDLLLTDIRMPFISGLELARQVREVRPSTQIAFLSGYDDFSYAQEAIRYNIISYLLKPISLEELSENLRQIKEKLDRIFSEFSERRRTGPDVAEFLLPLLLDGSQTEVSGDREEREARLMEQAVACRFLEPVHSNIHYVVISVSLWDGEERNCTSYGDVHAINGILRKYIKGEAFFLEDKITAVLAATPAALDKYLHIIIDEIVQSIERILGLHCYIGAGRVTGRLSGLAEGYRASVSAMSSAGQSGGSSVLYIADLEAQKNKGSMDICERALRYIEETYADAGLSLMTTSQEVGVSPNYLSALIKKKTGRSFVDYLTAKRMETARRLLLDTGMKVREIAQACGYSDQHYFSYCFKKYAGLSPNMLRQQAGERERHEQ